MWIPYESAARAMSMGIASGSRVENRIRTLGKWPSNGREEVAKLDITEHPTTIDRALENESLTPLQRQMLENYHRHSLLEISGQWERIFEPGMFVDEPHYILSFKGGGIEVKGLQNLKDFYKAVGQPVIVLQHQELHLSERSFTSISTSNHFVTGAALAAMGFPPENLDGLYIRRKMGLTFWIFDERGRLIGERGGEAGPVETIEVAPEDFITPEEARAVLDPLVRPLPQFNG